ncbi:hypothetical protein [Reichenbachiella sp.]
MMEYFLWACALGALSAVSLPLGSWIGIRFRFTSSQISILAAFGAGALLAALSVELIAPTTLALVETTGENELAIQKEFYVMIMGCVLGGLIYITLDHIVNKQGGFLRKTGTLLRYYSNRNRKDKKEIIQRLSSFSLFQNFPTQNINDLISVLEPVDFKDGDNCRRRKAA